MIRITIFIILTTFNTNIHFSFVGDGRMELGADNSLVISMEINGVMYQGVLFAQLHQRRI